MNNVVVGSHRDPRAGMRGVRSSRARAEACEPRRLLATISGSIYNDADLDGVRDAGEGGAANRTLYIDVDADGVLDADVVSNFNGGGLPHEIHGRSDLFGSVLTGFSVSGLNGLVKDVNFTVDITHARASDLLIDAEDFTAR